MEDGIVLKEEPLSGEETEDRVIGEVVLIKQEVECDDEHDEEEVGNSRRDEVGGYPMIKQEGDSTADPLGVESDVHQGSPEVQKSETEPSNLLDGPGIPDILLKE
ncbi:hypothetical protein GE061_008621 [Apolygus lucorum]|uniref:Uncharacterized protein n=1 Tax=Apolygus lucorum TaxID=248454 RepID=A0A8S9WQG2_APOLU|nr:hypothetical protein GE061_008621 [Apolygus lucorum]